MVESSRILRTLRFISETSFNGTPSTAQPTSLARAPIFLRSLPHHKPLLPLLLSHGIPSKLARVCADRYDKYAIQLRSETETKLAPHLLYHCENPPASAYPVFLKNYNQALKDWAQSILNAALRRLERDSADIQNWSVTDPPSFWLPVSRSLPKKSFRVVFTLHQIPLDKRSKLRGIRKVSQKPLLFDILH